MSFMTDAPYLGAVKAAVPAGFTIRHQYSDDGLHDIADQLRTSLASRGQWRPLVAAFETAVTSPAGLAFIRSLLSSRLGGGHHVPGHNL